jgi:hypothetical protein
VLTVLKQVASQVTEEDIKPTIVCNCEKLIAQNMEIIKSSKETIERSDQLLTEFKSFILQMRHVESL